MKVFTTPAMDEIKKGTAIVSGAVEILSTPPIRVWGGYGVLQIGGVDYQPIGDRGIAQVSSGALGGAAQNVSLGLSGIEPEALELLDAEDVRRAPVTLYRLIFSSDGQTMLDAQVFTRARLDQLNVDDVIGGTATITALLESAARGLGRRGGRMRTDADQRLIAPTDGFFKHVAFAGEKTLYWGGKRPANAGVVLNGGNVGAGGFSGNNRNIRIQ